MSASFCWASQRRWTAAGSGWLVIGYSGQHTAMVSREGEHEGSAECSSAKQLHHYEKNLEREINLVRKKLKGMDSQEHISINAIKLD